MPFKSEQQRKFMYARHPEIAKRWSAKYGDHPKYKALNKRLRGSGNA